MPLDPGKLKHRVTIQKPVVVQDQVTGTQRTRWVNVATDIAAAVEFLSVREFVASQSMQSQIVARIQVRYRDDLNATMRILHKSKIYNPAGWLPDNESGLEWLTAPCSEGVSVGD